MRTLWEQYSHVNILASLSWFWNDPLLGVRRRDLVAVLFWKSRPESRAKTKTARCTHPTPPTHPTHHPPPLPPRSRRGGENLPRQISHRHGRTDSPRIPVNATRLGAEPRLCGLDTLSLEPSPRGAGGKLSARCPSASGTARHVRTDAVSPSFGLKIRSLLTSESKTGTFHSCQGDKSPWHNSKKPQTSSTHLEVARGDGAKGTSNFTPCFWMKIFLNALHRMGFIPRSSFDTFKTHPCLYLVSAWCI